MYRLIRVAVIATAIAVPLYAGEIQIGVEYCIEGSAHALAPIGVPAIKPLPDPFGWRKMQSAPDRPIDFKFLDGMVKECQNAGFKQVVLGLKPNSPWGVRNNWTNFTPKPEYGVKFSEWIRAIVERYDCDGADDMPGLKFPVRHYEIGVEYSTYQMGPVEDYIAMLKLAHAAAKSASSNCVVMHAAFLTTTMFNDRPKPAEYDAAYARVNSRIAQHPLSSLRKILDHPDLFDAVNFHAVGDPYEIEDTAAWLRWEMKQRRYDKPLIISDTTPTPFIAWGPATEAAGKPHELGLIIPPAVEADRPRLAAFFQKLLDGDKETEAWTRSFVAADMVQKVVIAAASEIELIDTSFTEDLVFLKVKILKAGAGVGTWGGMVETVPQLFKRERKIVARHPSFYAIKQLQTHLKGYTKLTRVETRDSRARIYRVEKPAEVEWIAWLDPQKLILPGDPIPELEASIAIGADATLKVETLITDAGRTEANSETMNSENKILRVKLTPVPIFMIETN